jgi:hypothetical protein
MIISGNNLIEYNELLKLSVEDFLIRFKLFIDDIDNGK